MMLKPTMSELLDIIPNRYLLVNVAAKRARDIADASEQAGEPLDEKPVKLALYDIMEGRVRPAEGPVCQEEAAQPEGPAYQEAAEQQEEPEEETGETEEE